MSGEAQRAPGLLSHRFALIAGSVTRATGHPLAFVLSCVVIALWVIVSVVFHITDAWQSRIDTITTIMTFLMVFLIQSTQRRDGAAVQAKLDELIRALEPAKNKFIGIENRPIGEVYDLCQETAEETKMLEEPRSDGARARSS